MLTTMLSFGYRMVRTTDARLLWKIGYNFGYKGIRSVQRFKAGSSRGRPFPLSLRLHHHSCNLRCQGCWVDVDKPQSLISFEDMNRLIGNAKAHGNSFFGILGGSPSSIPTSLPF